MSRTYEIEGPTGKLRVESKEGVLRLLGRPERPMSMVMGILAGGDIGIQIGLETMKRIVEAECQTKS